MKGNGLYCFKHKVLKRDECEINDNNVLFGIGYGMKKELNNNVKIKKERKGFIGGKLKSKQS